jgi:hypothetical protein
MKNKKQNKQSAKSTTSQSINMSMEEKARWMCLAEAISVVDQKMTDMQVDPDEVDWVNPIAFGKYIKERYHSMLYDLKCEIAIENASAAITN